MCNWNGKQYLFVVCYEAVMGTLVPLGRVFPASTVLGSAPPPLAPGVSFSELDNEIREPEPVYV